MRTKRFESLRKLKARVCIQLNAFKPPSNLLLTVRRWYFCCGSSVLHVMSVCIWSLAIWSAEYQMPIMLPVLLFCKFKIENR